MECVVELRRFMSEFVSCESRFSFFMETNGKEQRCRKQKFTVIWDVANRKTDRKIRMEKGINVKKMKI